MNQKPIEGEAHPFLRIFKFPRYVSDFLQNEIKLVLQEEFLGLPKMPAEDTDALQQILFPIPPELAARIRNAILLKFSLHFQPPALESVGIEFISRHILTLKPVLDDPGPMSDFEEDLLPHFEAWAQRKNLVRRYKDGPYLRDFTHGTPGAWTEAGIKLLKSEWSLEAKEEVTS